MNEHDIQTHCKKMFELTAVETNEGITILKEVDAIPTFYSGLASFQVYRETHDNTWVDSGKLCKAKIELWARQGAAWNFAQKVQLLEAECQYCDGNFDCAKDLYASAIASAREHKYINEEALACECAARFYLDTGNTHLSIEHFVMAHERYAAWGATEKVNQLARYLNETFGIVLDNEVRTNEVIGG